MTEDKIESLGGASAQVLAVPLRHPADVALAEIVRNGITELRSRGYGVWTTETPTDTASRGVLISKTLNL